MSEEQTVADLASEAVESIRKTLACVMRAMTAAGSGPIEADMTPDFFPDPKDRAYLVNQETGYILNCRGLEDPTEYMDWNRGLAYPERWVPATTIADALLERIAREKAEVVE